MTTPRLCVLCRVRPVDPRWRPFCGQRCRDEDLARWADGRYQVPGEEERDGDGHGTAPDDDSGE